MMHALKLLSALGMAVAIALIWGFVAGCQKVDALVETVLDDDD